jgi:hypothetical protein
VADEKISQMPPAGTLDGTEIVPVVRIGSPNVNLSTTIQAIASLASGINLSLVPINTTDGLPQTYTLPAAPSATSEIIIVADISGNAQNSPITIIGANPGITINQNYGSMAFIYGSGRWVAF